MGAGFRRFVRRVLFVAGVAFAGVALTAMLANQFRVVYVWHNALGGPRRYYFERGVVRCVWTSAPPPALARAGLPLILRTPANPSSSVIPGLGSPPPPPPPSPWSFQAIERFSPRDAAFGPYEWLPRYADDGSARTLVLPWWMLGALGGGLMCAGLWGIRAPKGHCRKCEYDLRGLPAGAGVCPECGATLPAASAPSAASPCASSTSAHA